MDSFAHLSTSMIQVYVTLFSLLGLFTSFTHIPSDSKFSGYRKSRLTLGGAFFFMAAYCVARLFMPSHHADYLNFWLLMTVSLIFVWLNYSAFLFLIDSSYSIRKTFAVDGIVPVSAMFVVGLCGQFFPAYQVMLQYLLGAVFITKCVRMFYVCEREWRKVNEEQQNYYDEDIDITWMRVLVWLTLGLSLCTILGVYIHELHILYGYFAPLVFVYMTLRMVNYLPKKIDDMRLRADSIADAKGKPAPTVKPVKSKELPTEKIAAGVERWIAEKRYCTPELTIKEVAEQIGTNQKYFSQYLNDTLEITFQSWLNTLRIEESKRILTNENISVEEVSIRVGILQSYNFSRWFKTITGTTPFKYRKEESRNRLLAS